MGFDVDAGAYARFMGRFSEPLAAEFTALLDVRADDRVLDVGCGPGALTTLLVERTGAGAGAVAAVDPSAPFVDAVRARLPGVDVHLAAAEALPFGDGAFDLAVAQLVVQFMADPVVGLTEMARVTRPGGRVAACVWDHAGGAGPLATFWRAAHVVDPHAPDESARAGVREGHLTELFDRAGLRDVGSTVLTVRVGVAGFDAWWEPFTLGVGPAGAYVAALDDRRRRDLRTRCAELLPTGPFEVTASAWTAVGRV